ncbi:MAG: serine/threonine protein kinase [Bryobacterales bacterium]|nr:serine/threonine protein kinase [Bryobacterales bacterium]
MERIGRYRIAGEVGRGAMGVVYRAVDPAIGRDVAIKTIRLDAAGGHSVLQERLFREAQAAGVLSHPNIVIIYDMGEAEVEGVGPVAWVAMGLVKGPSLETLMLAPEPIPGPRMISILRQTAIALDYAHSRGLVHRDIKPGNIMTDEDGSVKITDFGIARFVASQHQNETETITGTPNYMSPEQVQGLEVDGRTDQFALAVIAWEILTGERPFPGDNLSTVVYKIVSEDPAPAHQLNSSLTSGIDDVLRRALAKNPAARFANCASFVGALETACAAAPLWKPAPNGSYFSMPTVGVNWEKPVVQPMPIRPPAVQGPERPMAHASAARAAASREELPLRAWGQLGSRLLITVALLALVAFGAVMFWPPNAGRRSFPETTAPQQTTARQTTERQTTPQQTTAQRPAAAPVKVPESPPLGTVADARAPEPAAIPEEPAAAKNVMQDIWLDTSPPDARATLDGSSRLSCTTPCVLHARPGVHKVTFALNGYRLESREVHVQDRIVDLPAVQLQEVMGSLLVATTPPGASIMLNGEYLPQTTPAALTLKPGAYRITVARNGVSRTERVQVSDRPHLLKIPLDQ